MKIGILTFHNCTNYGAVLQAYSLWKTLSHIANESVEIIDYVCPKISTEERVDSQLKQRSLRGGAKAILSIPYEKRKLRRFQHFLNEQSCLSARRYDGDTLSECAHEYGCVVFGSDQIWNLALTGSDYHYFGDFSNDIRKIAYAASAGNVDWSANASRIKALLSQFSSLSVREEIDRRALWEVCGLQAQHVLDPTLLLDEAALRSAQKPIRTPPRYILCYFISPQKGDLSFAKQKGKELKLPVLYVTYSWRVSTGVVNLRDVSPEQFIYLLNHAELVITNSFHGTMLSLGLKRNFYCQVHGRGARANARMEEVLDRLGLASRIVRQSETNEPYQVLDWTGVSARLKEERAESIAYLTAAVRGGKR